MRWVVRALLLGVLVGVYLWAARHLDLSWGGLLSGVRGAVEPLGVLGPLLFIAICIGGILAHAPEIVLIAIGGAVFGAFEGFVYGWIGAVLGSTASFLIARYVFRDAIERSLLSRYASLQRLDRRLGENGLVTVLLLRAVLFMAPPLNWVLGATRVRFRDYLAGSALGVAPLLALTVYLADTVTRSASFAELVRDPRVTLPAVLVVGLSVASVLVGQRLFGNPSPSRTDRARGPDG